MARLQILQLPEGASDDRAPFILVIDQAEPAPDPSGAEALPSWPDDLAEKIGARAVLAFETTVDIPANEIAVGSDGYPLRVRIEGDFDQFREQVQAEASAASNVLAGARYIAERYGDPSAQHPAIRAWGSAYDHGNNALARIGLARQALAEDGYFTADQIGDDIGPRITEWLSHHRERVETAEAERDKVRDRLMAAAQLHHRVEHRGQVICAHCSAWDGPDGSTDNAPILWPCDTVKALTGWTEEATLGHGDA